MLSPVIKVFQNKLFLFFLVVGITSVAMEIYLMQPILKLGLGHDDWILISRYDQMGPNPLVQVFPFFKKFGPYITTDGLYITLMHHLFNENYKYYHFINIFLKSLATLAVFPCVYIIFKNKLLAALTTILYATSYSATASFELSSKGTNYLSTLVMLIYFIIYHQLVTKFPKSWLWHLLLTLSFWGAILISPPRMYPLLQIPIFIEIFLLAKRGIKSYKTSLARLVVTYLPGLLIAAYIPKQIFYSISRKPEFLMRIATGDWSVLTTPLSGLGYPLFPSGSLISGLGKPILTSTLDFIQSILPYFFVFLVLFNFLYYIRIKGSRVYLILYILLYLGFTSIIYFLTINHPAEGAGTSETLLGVFIIVVAVLSLWRYLYSKTKDSLLVALATGPLISLWFITYTWYVANLYLSFRTVHSYLTIPSLGIYLWLATLIVIFYQAIRKIFLRQFGFVLGAIFVSATLWGILVIDYQEIKNYWDGKLNNGWDAATQDSLYYQTVNLLNKRKFTITKPTLIYFDTSQDPVHAEVYEQGFTSHFFHRIHHINKTFQDGCVIIVPGDLNLLQKVLTRKSDQLILLKDYVCFSLKAQDFLYKSYQTDPLILEQFYAFSLNNRQITDITEEVLEKIQ